MKTISATLFGLTVVLLLSFCTSETPAPIAEASTAAPSQEELIKRGEYLVHTAGCWDCHSPKVFNEKGMQPDMTRWMSGHPSDEPLPAITDPQMKAPGQWVLFSPGLTAAVGPWGTSFAANLTPDDTGIGMWTFDQFKKALREGKSKGMDGTRPLLPPMPWENVGKMTDADLEAIFTYLKSIPPVRNAVPRALPPAEQVAG